MARGRSVGRGVGWLGSLCCLVSLVRSRVAPSVQFGLRVEQSEPRTLTPGTVESAQTRIWRIAGISRSRGCRESQRFLEDHEQSYLLDPRYDAHARVSAEDFCDATGVRRG